MSAPQSTAGAAVLAVVLGSGASQGVSPTTELAFTGPNHLGMMTAAAVVMVMGGVLLTGLSRRHVLVDLVHTGDPPISGSRARFDSPGPRSNGGSWRPRSQAPGGAPASGHAAFVRRRSRAPARQEQRR